MIFFEETYVGALFAASVVYWLIPHAWRTWFITLFSFGALLTIQPVFTLCLLPLVGIVYLAALRMAQAEHKGVWLLWGVIGLTAFLLLAKYLLSMMQLIFGQEAALTQMIIVPLGVSYLSFKLIAFCIDVYRGTIESPRLLDLVAFTYFLPSFPAGPIVRYQEFVADRQDNFELSEYVDGLRRILIGFFKKVVIVNFLFNETLLKVLEPQILGGGFNLDLPAEIVVLYLVGALVYAYIDLSAYADLAIGFGKLFGYRLPENMNYPLFQSNLSDYWSRWHMTLSSWCRNNVYFPVLGSTRNNTLALYASFVVMGLWHNVSLNWFIWGLWHASGITVYSRWSKSKRKLKKKLGWWLPQRIDYTIGVLITCFYSAMGFAFIMMDGKENMLSDTHNAIMLLADIIF